MSAFTHQDYLAILQGLPPGELIPCLVHDLNNRINTIKVAVRLIQEEPEKCVSEPDVAVLIQAIATSVEDLHAMSQASIEYHRQNQGQ
jgi:hypothetical protein